MKKIEDILNSERIWWHTIVFPVHSAWIKLPDCGTCSVIWSENEDGMEHVSVSPKKKFRVPTWDDMCVLKDVFFEDEEEAYQIHPKKSEYVNAVENCQHLWKPKGHEINELISKGGSMSEKCNRACWNCWYDEFCDWHPAGDEDACEEYIADEEG